MDVTYTPYYTILAIIVLFIVPIVFHSIAFKKSTRSIHILTSILIGNFILAFIQEITGLTGTFNAKFILVISLFLACVIGYWVSNKNFFSEKLLGSTVSIKAFYFILSIAIFVFLYQKNTYPPYSMDTLTTYLPWARTIIDESSIPAFHFGSNYRYFIHYPPLLYTNIAFLFSFFGEYNDSLTIAIPIIYTCFFYLLIVIWSKDYPKIASLIPLFVLLLSLLSPLFVRITFLLLQETPLMFYITVSFYFLIKYIRTKEIPFLLLLSVSSSLASLTKYSGQVIAGILFCILIITWIKDKKEINKILIIFPMIHIPGILWGIRNYYFFNNVFFSEFSWATIIKGYSSIGLGFAGVELPTTFHAVAINVIYEFPAIVISLMYMIKNRKEIEVRFTSIFCIIFLFIAFYADAWKLARYIIYPFLGIFLLFAGIEISQSYNKIPLYIRKINLIIMAVVVLCIFLIINPAPISLMSDAPIPISNMPSLKINNYLPSLKDRLDPAIFYPKRVYDDESGILHYFQNKGEKDIIILGDHNYKCNWYGDNCTSLIPESASFSIINNEEAFDFTENSTYIYIKLNKLGISYLFDSPRSDFGFEKKLIDKINQDPEHFELVYNNNGYRLWKIK